MPGLAEWRTRLLDGLGDQGVDVELTERQLDYALRRARQLFNKHQPRKTWWFLGTLNASLTHQFTLDETYGAMVLDVEFKDSARWLSTPIVSGAFELRYGVRGPAIYYEYLVADRRYEYFVGESPDWRWVPEDRALYITNPRRIVNVTALFVRENTLEEIPSHKESDFEDLSLGFVKVLLARILGAYGSIPGATGDIPNDAAQLREDGLAEIARIRDLLERSPASYFTPRYIG